MVGIRGYGCAVARLDQHGDDRDYVTLAVEAAERALEHAVDADRSRLGALYIGTPSVAIGPRSRAATVRRALGLPTQCHCADLQSGQRSGLEAFFAVANLVKPSAVELGLAIASDSPSRGDDAAADGRLTGAVAFVFSRLPGELVATLDIEGVARRQASNRPVAAPHAEADFDPAAANTLRIVRELMLRKRLTAAHFSHVILHAASAAFPDRIGTALGFSTRQLAGSRLAPAIDPQRAPNALLGLAGVLDVGATGERVLIAAHDPDHGADAYVLTLTDQLLARRQHATPLRELIGQERGDA